MNLGQVLSKKEDEDEDTTLRGQFAVLLSC